jgi:hypothetical protein
VIGLKLISIVICPQEVAQSAGTTPHEAEVISSNPPPPSCVDMSKIYICISIVIYGYNG